MTSGSVSPAAAVRKLPVFRSTVEVFAGVTRHFFELLRIALVPVVLSFGIFAAAALWVDDPALVQWMVAVEMPLESEQPDSVADEEERSRSLLFGLAVLASYLIYVPAIVSWHRFVLFGEKSPLLVPRSEDMRYVIAVLKLALAALFFLIPAVIAVFGVVWLAKRLPGLEEGVLLSPQGASIAVAVIAGYLIITGIVMRMSLALPDAAVGGKGGIENMIDRTRGNTWRLIWFNTLMLLAVSVIVLLNDFATKFVVGLEPEGVSPLLLAILVNVPLTLYVSMLSVTMLSVAYREIVGLPGDATPATTASEPVPAA
jgi:hypothetical protein